MRNYKVPVASLVYKINKELWRKNKKSEKYQSLWRQLSDSVKLLS